MKTSKSYRVQQTAQNINSDQLANSTYQIANNQLNPQEILQGRELTELLQKAIFTLKGKQKTVLILRDLDGHSYEEIANITGLKLGTVRSTLNRARLKVAGIISKKLER